MIEILEIYSPAQSERHHQSQQAELGSEVVKYAELEGYELSDLSKKRKREEGRSGLHDTHHIFVAGLFYDDGMIAMDEFIAD